MFGGVGCGKTAMMDLFYGHLGTSRKQRVHFNEFMLSVHRSLHAQGQRDIGAVSDSMAREKDVLCLDEFQVIDIADAMVLRSLISGIMGRGTPIVTTSNRAPESMRGLGDVLGLYENGIQRGSFLPCIEFIMNNFRVIDMSHSEDYRTEGLGSSGSIVWPLDVETGKVIENEFVRQCKDQSGRLPCLNVVARGRLVGVNGRLLSIDRCCDNSAFFTFDELCAEPLYAADYIAISKTFKTIFVTGIPVFTDELENEARRFITLIDVLYDAKVHGGPSVHPLP